MILFYLSGHGYGHATRSRAVIEELLKRIPEGVIHVRTAAPAFIFEGFPAGRVRHWPVRVEPPVIESADALSVDGEASARDWSQWIRGLDELVCAEVAFAQQAGVRLIVGDIPFAAGCIASAAGLPSVAIGNFTWDWIFQEVPGSVRILADIREGYRRFDLALRLPLAQEEGWQVFRVVRDVPLVTPRSARPREEIREQLGIPRERTAILIGGRARMGPAAMQELADSCPEYAFLPNDALPSFHDLVRASDVVVSKVGYSIAAECIAEGTALLFPPRKGFREEEVLTSKVPEFTRAIPIPAEDWRSGRWGPYIAELLRLPAPKSVVDPGGAAAVADILAAYLE